MHYMDQASVRLSDLSKWAARFAILAFERRWPITSTLDFFCVCIGKSDKMSSIKPYSWPPFVEF